MLAITDMPTGWAVNTVTPPLTANPTSGSCNGPNAAARAEAAGSTAMAESQYIKDPVAGPYLSEVVWAFPTPKQAKAFMKANRKVVASCPRDDYVNPVDGQTYHRSLGAESFTKVGDEALATRVTQSLPNNPGSITSASDSVFARSGRFVLNLANGGLSVDSNLTSQYTRKALDKLAPVLKK
jgi:hypothetical protein